MITLLLLHPLKQTPVQVWPFKSETVIRIGRSTDNDVILYSAVVSRHHVELHRSSDSWEVINLGTNGTYVDGKRVAKVPVTDGAIIRLARSGPNIQIRLGPGALTNLPKHLLNDQHGGRTSPLSSPTDAVSDSPRLRPGSGSAEDVNPAIVTDRSGASLFPRGQVESQADSRREAPNFPVPERQRVSTAPSVSRLRRQPLPTPPLPAASPEAEGDDGGASAASVPSSLVTSTPTTSSLEVRAADGSAWRSIRGHRIHQILGQGDIGITYLADIAGKSVVLKTLNASWAGNDTAEAALQMEAELLRQVQHPKIPQVLGQFWVKRQPYLVMEHISGSSLAHYVTAHGAVPLRQAIAWMVDLCRVLGYLHSFAPPIFHRNIEPANLIRRPSGDLALIGFGTIKALVLERLKAVGAAGFIAPGQLEFNACPQVDFYPIAATLVYLVSGQNPLRFCERQRNSYRLNPDAVPQLSPSLRHVLSQLTRGRYQSAEEVAEALTTVA